MIDFRLYLVTDRNRCAPRALQAVVREACDAGVRAVQLREHDLGPGELEAWCTRLLEITRPREARLFVNLGRAPKSDPEAFIGLGVDGFHVPDAAPFPSALRRRFPHILIGVSTHSAERARAAEADGADFVTFGPVYATPSKARYGPPQGIDALAAACEAVSVPVFAIGGGTPERAAECVSAGAHGVAAIGAILAAPDVAAAVSAFSAALGTL